MRRRGGREGREEVARAGEKNYGSGDISHCPTHKYMPLRIYQQGIQQYTRRCRQELPVRPKKEGEDRSEFSQKNFTPSANLPRSGSAACAGLSVEKPLARRVESCVLAAGEEGEGAEAGEVDVLGEPEKEEDLRRNLAFVGEVTGGG